MKECGYCLSCMERLEKDLSVCPFCGCDTKKENAAHQLPAGTILEDRYLIGSVIGEGGFGITYIGRDLRLDMKVAVKEFYPVSVVGRRQSESLELSASRPDQAESFERGKEKFLEEARTLARFSADSNIVCVRDFFTANQTAYIVMEFLEGESLQRYLSENGPMPFGQAYLLLEPVMEALDEVHAQHLIHRDISPSNLMLLKDGRVKLLDFGTARHVNYAGENSLSVTLKPGYAPQEQYNSHGAQGPWTDVYAMCATIYKLITGVTPENSMNRLFRDTLPAPSQLGAKLSRAEEEVLLRGMAVQQRDRIQSMRDLIDAFGEAAAESDAAFPAPDVTDTYEEEDERTISGPKDPNASWKPSEGAAVPDQKIADPSVSAKSISGESVSDKSISGEADSAKGTSEKADSAKGTSEKADSAKGTSGKADSAKGTSGKAVSGKKTADRAVRNKKTSKKSGSKRKWLLLLIPCVLVIVVLILMNSGIPQTFSDSSYKDGSRVYIKNETLDESMLKQFVNDQEVTRLVFYQCEISDEMVQMLAQMDWVEAIELSKCEGFTTLSPLSAISSLSQLSVSSSLSEETSMNGSEMFSGDFSQVSYLTLYAYVFSDGLTFLSGFPALTSLSLNYCTGFDDATPLSQCESLAMLYLDGSDAGLIDLSPLGSCQALSWVSADGCGLTTIEWMSTLTNLISVSVSDNQISSLQPLSASVSLRYLYADNNQIENLSGLEGHEALTYVSAANNQITDISALPACDSLVSIDFSGNQITDITALSAGTSLITVDFRSNQITDIDALSQSTGIKYLYLTNNQIENLDACERMIDLEKLYASNNRLTDISGLSNVTQMTDARLFNNQISDISVLAKSAAVLETLLIGDNQITDLSALSGSTALYFLGVENNLLSSLSGLEESSSLYYLSAYGNQISDITAISGCTSLYYIDLGENAITNIASLPASDNQIQVLLLQNNQIQDITTLAADCEYVGLSLYNNPISDFSVIGAMKNAGYNDILYVSYDAGWDYSLIAQSSYTKNIRVVDAPLDQQANIKNIQKEVKQSSIYQPEFLTLEEADAEIAEYRAKIADKAKVSAADEDSTQSTD